MRAGMGRAAGRRGQGGTAHPRCDLHRHRDEAHPVRVYYRSTQGRYGMHHRAARRTVHIRMGRVCSPPGWNGFALGYAMMVLVRPRTGMMRRMYAGRNDAPHHKQRQKHGGCYVTRNAHGCAVRVYWIETLH